MVRSAARRKRARPRSLRSWLYALARFMGDVNAIRRGPSRIVRRLGRKAVGRMAGRTINQIFR
jgi:hypothetical protein